MTNSIIPKSDSDALALVGQTANQYASQNVFDDYRVRRAANTLRRQRADLHLFTRFLTDELQTPLTGDLQTMPDAWRGVTWGLVAAFVRWQLQQGYAVQSVNVRLSTVKQYAKLAFQAGSIDPTEHALIRTVTGYQHRETKEIDKKREADGVHTRIQRSGAKKAVSVTIPDDVATDLKRPANDSAQARRDALLMCLLLDHGLRVGEVAWLKVSGFNLADGTMTFYRPKVHKVQTHTLSRDTRRALKAYIDAGDCPLSADAHLLGGSLKSGVLSKTRMSARAITKRVQELGMRAGLSGLSAHDCRHYWATRASRKGTDPFSLQEAGGWNSLAMPRRYVEAARIANEGVKLE